MRPGNFVLDILKDAPEGRKTIAVIRHSARNSFDGVPIHLRDQVEITPEGILMAKEWGATLGKIQQGRTLCLGHTAVLRCRMTAEAICNGYPPGIPVRILGCEPEITSPVKNLEEILSLMNEVGGREVIRRWADEEIPETLLQNPHRYADAVLRTLFSYTGTGDKDLLVVIAHDITIFPLVLSVFGKTLEDVEFLNGMVISVDSDMAEFRFADSDCSLKVERESIRAEVN